MPACERLVAAALRAADRRDALRPFVDAQGSCRRRGRCRGRNRDPLPTAAGGRSCRAGCRACPWGTRAVAMAIWPLSTRVKRSRISSVGSPIGDGAGDVGGAVDILAARIDQIERARLELAVGLLARLDSGRSRRSARRRKCVSNDRSRSSGFSRRSASRWSDAVSSSTLALGRFLLDPLQEARDRRAVARLGGLLAGDFGRILDRLGQDGRVAHRQDLRAGLVERLEDRRDRAFGIDGDGLALQLARARSRIPRARAAGRRCRDAGERRRRPSRTRRTGRRCRRRGPAHRPARPACGSTSAPRTLNAQAIESSADRTAASACCLASQSAISVRFSAAILPAYWSGWTTSWAFEASGRSLHTSSIGLRSTGDQLGAAGGQRLARLLHPVAAVQPRVVADPRALRRMLLEPVRRCWSPAPTGSSTRRR